MESATAQRLLELNRAFYDAHAEDFADSRPRLAAGMVQTLTQIAPGARVLEVGCGDGKVGRWLMRHARPAAYLGLDFSEGMLSRARRYSIEWPELHFASADLTDPDWPRALPPHPFDWALMFATLQHIPGDEARASVVRALAQCLAPGGTLVMSNWQFTRSARLRQRIRAWESIGLSAAEVDDNDYLLTWERKGRHGLRYVHVVETHEAERWAAEAGLTIVEVFQSDGGSGALSEYVRMGKSG